MKIAEAEEVLQEFFATQEGKLSEAWKEYQATYDEMTVDLDELDKEVRVERDQLRERIAGIADNLADMGLLTNTPKAKFDFVWGRS